ncbi:MAG TPA: DNA methyltransferase [Dehalococcoidia bacterium]|nr:DNA methyltransferase [Dehalococcoidia bacterium]
MSASGVAAARPASQQAGGGATPTPVLQSLEVRPIPILAARRLIEREHYLHSLPGGTRLAFGVFMGSRLMGALALGVGPLNAYSLVQGATPEDCLTLTRLWLSDELPRNSESRFIGIVLRSLKSHTGVKFLVSYADPAQGHIGIIYQATAWLYTGLSEAMPMYDIGDGKARHSRSLSHAFGTHSVQHFARHGIAVKLTPQSAKHRYVYFLDPTWQQRLMVPGLPYPKKEMPVGNH